MILRVFGKEGFEVRSISVASPLVTARVVDSALFLDKAGKNLGHETQPVTMEVEFRGTGPLGLFKSELEINTNEARRPKITVPISGRLVGDIEVRPERVRLEERRAGRKFAESVTLMSRSGTLFRVIDVLVESDTLPDLLAVRPSGSEKLTASKHEILLSSVTPVDSGPIGAKVTITTDALHQKVIIVPVQGYIVE